MNITHIKKNAISWYQDFHKRLIHQDYNATSVPYHLTRQEKECRNIIAEAIDKSANHNKGVLIVTAPAELDTLITQFISVRANIKLSHLHHCQLEKSEWASLNNSFNSSLDLPLYLFITDNDDKSIDITKIRENNISAIYLID